STCYLLLFQRSDPHHDLHSFPTRRSSDLSGASHLLQRQESGTPGFRRAEISYKRVAITRLVVEHEPVIQFLSTVLSTHFLGRKRSEEHTSELQSRENLVCRLLLEKKKNKI